jgi:cytochrome b
VPPRAEARSSEVASPLRVLIERLESARSVIEARFLGAGDVLAEALDGIAALVTKLDDMTHALGPETIGETTRQLADAAAKLHALPSQQRERRAGIDRLAALQADLAARMGDMRQSLAYMRAFTISIKITAGSIAHADAEFGVFAQEIALRVESGRAEVDLLDRRLAALKQELQAAGQRADALAQRCAAMIPAVPDQLLASAGLMAEHSRRTGAATAEAGKLARDVRRKVARMLSALQIGDITRQRVEHVQAGIALLEIGEAGIRPAAAAQIRAILAALLAAQLDSTLADFSREVTEVRAGLAGLAQDAAAMLRLRDVAYGQNAGGAGGMLRDLEQHVGGAVGLVTDIEQATAQARETGHAAAQAAQVLSDRLDAVQAMKSDVLYMALNTTLKSARLGAVGLPLTTIATELRAQAGILEGVANSCVVTLRSLIATTAELAGTDAEDETSGQTGEAPGAALLAAVERITTAGDATERDVAALATQGEAVIDLLTRSTDRVAFHDEVGDALAQLAEALRMEAAGAEPSTDEIAAQLQARFAKLGAIYTMAQERDIQAAIAQTFDVGPAEVEPPIAAPAPRADEMEDVLF